jgi:hypothetical protein
MSDRHNPTYKGHTIDHVEHNRRDDTYALISIRNDVVAELKKHEYLSQPQLRGLKHGRHRRAHPKIHSYSTGQSYFTVPAGAFIFSLSGSTWRTIDDATKRPIEDAGIRAGEIIAHRAWRLYPDGVLHSVYRDKIEWIPGKPMTGDVRHGYGVHAFKDFDLVEKYAYESQTSWIIRVVWIEENGRPTCETPPADTFVFGTVALWGEVVEHERGYRAEFAKIVSLDSIVGLIEHEATRALYRVRARYGINHQRQITDDGSQPSQTGLVQS